MDSSQISFTYKIHSGKDSLAPMDIRLLDAAHKAANMAYAPYSGFKVGVAIRTVDGDTVAGSNQENGAFPVGQCAERVALYLLTHLHGRKPIDTIAILADNEKQRTPASPCGSCRQLLGEYRGFQDNPVRLILASTNSQEIFEIDDVTDLLPLSFDGRFLGQ